MWRIYFSFISYICEYLQKCIILENINVSKIISDGAGASLYLTCESQVTSSLLISGNKSFGISLHVVDV